MPKAIFYLRRGTIGFRVFRVKGLGFRGLGRIRHDLLCLPQSEVPTLMDVLQIVRIKVHQNLILIVP